jgi:hypothetical protein
MATRELQNRPFEPHQMDNHLVNLNKLRFNLRYSPRLVSTHLDAEVETLRMLIDHLHMPSLKKIVLDFDTTWSGRDCVGEMESVRDALCGIASPRLDHVELV